VPHLTPGQTEAQLCPELELTLCFARPKTPENNRRIRALFENGASWNKVLGYAAQHKLLPALCDRWPATESDLHGDLLTSDQVQTLIDLQRQLGRNSLQLFGEMLRLYDLFEAGQVPAMPYKGPVLAWMAYRNFTLRAYADLDFVLPQRHIPRAVSLLQSHGYTPLFDLQEAKPGRGALPGSMPLNLRLTELWWNCIPSKRFAILRARCNWMK